MNILITGAAKRLGKFLSEYLAQQGHNIIIHYNNSAEEAEALEASLSTKYPDQCFYSIGHDLSVLEQLDGFMPKVFELVGNVDLLINNAAMFEYDLASNFKTTTLQKHLVVNSIAPMVLARDFINLSECPTPILIQILDNKVDSLNPDYFSYTISKMALKAFTEMCGMLPLKGEKAYGVAPSMILESGAPTVGKVDLLTKINPLQKRIPLSAIADAVAFLAQGSLTSGEIIYVDGGQTLLQLPRDVAFLDLDEEKQ